MRTLFTEGLRGEVQKATEIGPVPESWTIVHVEDYAHIISKGSSPKWQGFDYVEEGVLFVRLNKKEVLPGFLNGFLLTAEG